MDTKEFKTLKEELNNAFSDEYIYNAGLLIHGLAEKFFEERKLEGKVYFNDTIFEYCLIDILVDIARLKYFHDIELVNYIKLIAYTASWCLKRKPFQLIEGSEEEFIYINEQFALSLLLQAAGCYDESVEYVAEEREKIIKIITQIFYHLKYRNTNPQTLELLLVGIDYGKKMYKTA